MLIALCFNFISKKKFEAEKNNKIGVNDCVDLMPFHHKKIVYSHIKL